MKIRQELGPREMLLIDINDISRGREKVINWKQALGSKSPLPLCPSLSRPLVLFSYFGGDALVREPNPDKCHSPLSTIRVQPDKGGAVDRSYLIGFVD